MNPRSDLVSELGWLLKFCLALSFLQRQTRSNLLSETIMRDIRGSSRTILQQFSEHSGMASRRSIPADAMRALSWAICIRVVQNEAISEIRLGWPLDLMSVQCGSWESVSRSVSWNHTASSINVSGSEPIMKIFEQTSNNPAISPRATRRARRLAAPKFLIDPQYSKLQIAKRQPFCRFSRFSKRNATRFHRLSPIGRSNWKIDRTTRIAIVHSARILLAGCHVRLRE